MENSILEIAFSNVLEELKEVKQEQQKIVATFGLRHGWFVIVTTQR